MTQSSLLNELIEAFRCLPGVGPKSAQRMAFHALERERGRAKHLALVLQQAVERIGHCQRCRNFTENAVCSLCESPRRDGSVLCIVESPADVSALEDATDYNGLYFVLMGRLSPLDGIGPKDIGLDQLEQRLSDGSVRELILATNPTVEGEATAHYISELAAEAKVAVSRIAHGVPLGGELEYIDGGTLSHAFSQRLRLP
ncbi:recombination protein RecR [gamma proteobacterium HTCC5015]|nr:recombination protein RecR [gamma proteobacterium HTCC5015]